jgi:hypothetical protein
VAARGGLRSDKETRMNTRLLGLCAAALCGLSALTFAACGGDDDKGTATATTAAASTASASASSSASSSATGTASASASGTTTATQTTSGDNEGLSDVLKDTSKLTYKISYDITSTDDEGQPETGTYTLVNKPPKTRIEFSSSTASDESVIVIDDGTDTYLCTPTDKSCLKTPGTGAGLGGALLAVDPDTVVKDAEAEGATIKKTDDRTIAGTSASCYSVTDSDGTGSMCIAKDTGIVLLIDGTNEGSKIALTAKSFSTSVDDSEFKPPYDVTG